MINMNQTKDKVKVSPIRYMGNKRKLIKKGLCELFPSDIDIFYDLFGGSGVVGMNVNANEYVLNELDKKVFELYQMFKYKNPDDIIDHTLNRIDEFGLPTISTDKRQVGEEVRDFFKDKYFKFREYYNNNQKPEDLYVLKNYAMSQTIRFNKSGKFNMPFGNNRFIKEKHGQEIKDFHRYLQKVKLFNLDYREIDILGNKPFVYLDPPYLGSVATYNENGAWTKEDNTGLLLYLKQLDSLGIRWGMSNIIKNKNSTDLNLIEWVEENGFNIYYFSDFDYYSFGRGKSKSVEVFIYNY